MEIQTESRLVRLCIEAACESRESVEKWRKQRRTLDSMPSPLADALLRRLFLRGLLFPSLLEAFKRSVEVVDLRGASNVDAEWTAYLGAFRYLRSLNLADCHRINNSALWSLVGMTSLKEVDISRCAKVTDAGIRHLVSISTLQILRISETGVTADGIKLLSSLANLIVLDLGDLPVTDTALSSLQALTKLEYLDLWGSNISNKGATVLKKFPKLKFLSLAWTGVSRLPNLSSLECLNLSNCTINSVLQGNGNEAHLTKLICSGATFTNEAEAFFYFNTRFLSFLDVSNSSFNGFYFLHNLKAMEYLDLSGSMIGDDSIEAVASIGANLRNLNLSKTRVTSSGVAILVGHVPKLENLSLSHTPVDDLSVSCIGMMPSLKLVDLNNTIINGFIHQDGAEPNLISSLTALHSLKDLESLNLECPKMNDAAVDHLSSFQELRLLSLRSPSLTDISLHHLSSLPKIKNLRIRDAVLTDSGLFSFRPPATLEILDLRGCWLLTEDAILSFHKRHPLIEVRHEHVVYTSDQAACHRQPRTSQRLSQVNQKQEKLPVSQYFIDQRLKYTREELLALQFQSSSLGSPFDKSHAKPQMQSD
ncbi:receptor protein [Salix suchowensis]|uniref:F-BOX/LRR-REPEAT PROTEIN 13 n=1 Tax=Salix koriyanagi TaxID=2511006 RepID=A0A9Q0Q864_9ROSI|nr:receptor protein [Salix suchowensis]KAJ6701851.1 F-BOX/LRR-REPEAT PROTEIN 13 [Salix koriyanagi]